MAESRQEHRHAWDRSMFVGGLEIRHCTKDCPATQAMERGRWVRVDQARRARADR